MKQGLTLGLLWGMLCAATAQESATHHFYGGMDAQVGNYVGVDMHINYVYNQHTSFQLGYAFLVRESEHKPADFAHGLEALVTWGVNEPFDEWHQIYATVGRIYPLNQKGSIRLNAQVGLSVSIRQEPVNFVYTNQGGVGPNYSWDEKSSTGVGLRVSPKIEFPFSRYYGLSLTPTFHWTQGHTYVGVGIGHIFGKIR